MVAHLIDAQVDVSWGQPCWPLAVASRLASTLGVAFSKAEYPASSHRGGRVYREVINLIVHGLAPYASTALRLLLIGGRKQNNGLRGLLPVAVAVETVRRLK
jgi:hypothetical protein